MKRFLTLIPDLLPFFVLMMLLGSASGLFKAVAHASVEVGIDVAVDCGMLGLAGLYVAFLAFRQTLVDRGLWRVLGR